MTLRLNTLSFAQRSVFALALLGPAAAAHAQPTPPPTNVVQLSASGFKEVQQDWLSMSLNTTKEGPDAVTVQNQLKVALDAALAVAKTSALPQQLNVRTGQFSLYPRYSSNGKINGWQGSTELVLEGRDFARISATAGKIQTLTMGNVGFSLSREAQLALESDVQAMAMERFKLRASEIAKGFGFGAYSLREISVSSADQGGGYVRPRVMAMEAKAAMSDAPIAVEAGKSTVNVTISGTIQLR
ncbi:MAG: SIMPL domain-containing protein [Hydrogenophaga sp.]|jgi:predicted secreted protein|uniref:SIMPL domain-containing protein n=1 Tax=Hydrogenophaga sp. TaxID=1904254 RepID=UPI00275F65B6|nr:SIMPL domain-containing protein [Hydrogenophaga sp.]MDP2417371.1 SIMPL domain-containing protein [Hydrogenophaga sp.]MDZ4186570.1 SIMPL domain-containing protein [Hydrogenophaga sp.]